MAEMNNTLEQAPEKSLTNNTDYIRASLGDAYTYYQNNKSLDGWEAKDSYSLSNAMGAHQIASNTLHKRENITLQDIDTALEHTSYSSTPEYREAYLAYARGKWGIIQAAKTEENLLKKEVLGNPESAQVTKEESTVNSEQKRETKPVLEKNTKNNLTEQQENLSTPGTKGGTSNQSSEKREGMSDKSILEYNKHYIERNWLGEGGYYTKQFPELEDPTKKNIITIQHKLNTGFANTTQTIKLTQDGILGENTLAAMRKFIDTNRIISSKGEQKVDKENKPLLNLDQRNKEKIIGEGSKFIDKIIANKEIFNKFIDLNVKQYYLEDITPFNKIKYFVNIEGAKQGDLQMSTNIGHAYENVLSGTNLTQWRSLTERGKEAIIQELNTIWKKRANTEIQKMNTTKK